MLEIPLCSSVINLTGLFVIVVLIFKAKTLARLNCLF